MRLTFNTNSMRDYETFLAVRRCPVYRFDGSFADVPDEYAERIFGEVRNSQDVDYDPSLFLFDYQRDISRMAIRKRKFAAFVECGLGKTLILLEFARHAEQQTDGKPILIVC